MMAIAIAAWTGAVLGFFFGVMLTRRKFEDDYR